MNCLLKHSRNISDNFINHIMNTEWNARDVNCVCEDKGNFNFDWRYLIWFDLMNWYFIYTKPSWHYVNKTKTLNGLLVHNIIIEVFPSFSYTLITVKYLIPVQLIQRISRDIVNWINLEQIWKQSYEHEDIYFVWKLVLIVKQGENWFRNNKDTEKLNLVNQLYTLG